MIYNFENIVVSHDRTVNSGNVQLKMLVTFFYLYRDLKNPSTYFL